MDGPLKQKFSSQDEYFSVFPETTRKLLEQIRSLIKETVPEAEETISYNMPAFRFHGILLYYAGYKGHIGFYPGDAKTLTVFEDQIKGFETSKGTIRFPLNKKLPLPLIKKIVKYRAAANLEKAKRKTEGR